MSKIIKNGTSISLGEIDSIESKLPLGVYNLEYDKMFGFRLSETEQFILPPKIYGDTSIIQRSIAVYRSRPRNFGLLLSGLRGSGKSLTMKKLALELNQPVIILNESFEKHSNELIKFLTDPALGDCTILLDEFEKRFDEDDVTPLTLLDGLYNTHHFFILTVNNTQINQNLLNRPGRIYYHKSYKGLDDITIREVGEDLLVNKEYVNDLISVCEDIRDLSFDMLIAIINDINLFNENPKICVESFNFKKTSRALVSIYQNINNELRLIIADRWIESDWDKIWIEDCYAIDKDGKVSLTDVKVNLTKLTKISKSKYKLLHIEDESKDFNEQTLEFIFDFNPKPKFELTF